MQAQSPIRKLHSIGRGALPAALALVLLLPAVQPAAAGASVSFDLQMAAGFHWGIGYDDYGGRRAYGANMAEVWVEPAWGRYDPSIRVRIDPWRPSYLLIFGVTSWGQLVLLYPARPYEEIYYGPTVLHIDLPPDPWLSAETMTIYAITAPYPLVPRLPRYLVPNPWWRMGYRCADACSALHLGFVFRDAGFYWVRHHPRRIVHTICRDIWYAAGRPPHRPALGHARFHPERHGRFRWHGERDARPAHGLKTPRGKSSRSAAFQRERHVVEVKTAPRVRRMKVDGA
ncbi:MAG: hypothetical protein GF355_01350, partial [Candidatus Eisenbacteria bacterium]|nr:hypothetical protein [Candidatus Eisenbacteria bacterium]